MHGCNITGHQLALKNRWAESKIYYLKVCAADVRIGCENLIQMFVRGDDQTVPEDLDTICATNPRHFACDVRETTNFDGIALPKITNEFLREIEQELDADTPENEKQKQLARLSVRAEIAAESPRARTRPCRATR